MKVSICIPGLLWPDIGDLEALYSQAKLPYFEALINRSLITHANYSYSDLLYSCQYTQEDNLAQTIAKQHSITDYPYYLIAEPTHLRSDRDRLLICESELLQLSTEEATEIITAINNHFTNDLKIYYITDELWLIGLNFYPHKHQLLPLIDIIGENIDTYLAQGEHGLKLNSIFNEIQMLLFHLHNNEIRQQEGLLSVNSLWFWDKQLKPHLKSPFSQITTNNARIITNLEKITLLSPNIIQNFANNSLVIIDSLHSACCYRDHHTWLHKLEQLDQTLGTLLHQQINCRKIQQLDLLLPTHDKMLKLELKHTDRYKFWRKNSLTQLIKENT